MYVSVLNGTAKGYKPETALTERFLDGVYDHAEEIKKGDPAVYALTLNLIDLGIAPCDGCGACTGNPGKCIIKDQGQYVINVLCKSEFLLFVTPVIFWGISASLKAALDRMKAIIPEQLKGKKVILFTFGSEEDTVGFSMIKEQFQYICASTGMELATARHFVTDSGVNEEELQSAYDCSALLI